MCGRFHTDINCYDNDNTHNTHYDNMNINNHNHGIDDDQNNNYDDKVTLIQQL